MEQLSTGLQVNNASDNAAGLAIATRMQLQINGYAQDVQNANNGVDFAQTAEGAMTGMTQNLQRIYELANQSASYNTSSDRTDMNDEVQQLIAQLNSTVSQTEYNGSTFLNQAFSASFQTGNEVGQTINISTQNVAPNAFGVQASRIDFTNDPSGANLNSLVSTAAEMSLRGTGLSSAATINGQSLGAAIAASDSLNNSTIIINRVNQYTAQTNVTAFSFGNAYVGTLANLSTGVTTIMATDNVGFGAGYLTINGIAIGSISVADAALMSSTATVSDIGNGLVDAINAQTSQTGVKAVLLSSDDTGTANDSIALVNTTGAAINVSVATAQLTGVGATVFEVFNTSGASLAAGQNGQIIYSAPLGNTTATVDATNDSAALGISTAAFQISMGNAESINNISVSTVGNANIAILAVKEGINTMNNSQAYLGAIVNRFNSAVSELQSDSTNITAAKSSIMDADYAAETSKMTTAMITEQAGISMLAQANTLPQQVLTLLQKL